MSAQNLGDRPRRRVYIDIFEAVLGEDSEKVYFPTTNVMVENTSDPPRTDLERRETSSLLKVGTDQFRGFDPEHKVIFTDDGHGTIEGYRSQFADLLSSHDSVDFRMVSEPEEAMACFRKAVAAMILEGTTPRGAVSVRSASLNATLPTGLGPRTRVALTEEVRNGFAMDVVTWILSNFVVRAGEEETEDQGGSSEQ